MKEDNIRNDISEKLITREELNSKVKELAARINNDYKGKKPVMVSILKGSIVFLSELMKHITIESSIDFIAVSSYQGGTQSTGIVKMIMDLRESIEGRNVLLVEDIVDTGLTVAYLRDNLKTRRPASLKLCTLLNKPANMEIDIKMDYLGFKIPDKFVVGYGLDYQEKYRNLPFIGTLKPEIYRKKIK
ncbi:MAG: hypoxanthine phosphoribosyltransferase [Elusimicrobia bacterium]|jgi:hypoxanthine phosphoribosyltransferase|nr:hypoxanthine phosphoribosyltransferase [Elusimicrobiota bacterium]